MSPGRIAAGRARASRAIAALLAVSSCLGAVAYAANRPGGPTPGLEASKPVAAAPQHRGGGEPRGKGGERLPRARLIEYPEAISAVTEAQFRFHVPPRTQAPPRPLSEPGPGGEAAPTRRFQCQLDGAGWRSCSSPYRLGGLVPGAHAFAVRAFDRAGRPGPASSYSWRRVEVSPARQQLDPKPFSIELRGGLDDLYPGFPPQQLPILVTNPNPVAIEVTGLVAAIAGDPPNCAAENFALTQSSASPAAPLIVPAGASANLPTATVSAPTIAMLNLPLNQDACRGIEVPLVFEGEARG